MGDRAVLSLGPYTPETPGVYIHWYGNITYIEGFLLATKILIEEELAPEGERLPVAEYTAAKLVQCMTAFFSGGLRVGLGACRQLCCDNGDNGVYEIDLVTLTIVGRHFFEFEDEHAGDSPAKVAAKILKNL